MDKEGMGFTNKKKTIKDKTTEQVTKPKTTEQVT